MNTSERKDLLQRRYFAITAVIGIVLFATAIWIGGIATAEGVKETIKIICDGLFMTTALMIGCWLIGLGWYTGSFDVFLFAASFLFVGKHREDRNQVAPDLLTYREKKKLERRYPSSPFAVGLVFLILAIISYIVYKRL